MIFIRKFYLFSAVILCACLLTACLRGELTAETSSGGNNGSGGGGIVTSGVVTRFGSVFVNGIEYTSSSANIVIDEISNGLESSLGAGMVVTIKGTNNGNGLTGSANSITYSPDLRGPVDGAPTISGENGNFSVFGQVIVTDTKTIYDSAQGLAGITNGLLIEVSGYRDSAGLLHATRVMQNVSGSDFVIQGTIAAVTSTTFNLGSLSVNYTGSNRSNFPAGGLTNGLSIKVRADVLPSANVLTATSVEVLATGIAGVENQQVQIQGFIKNFSGTSFNVNRQSISTASSTVFENGASTDLTNDAQVNVIGIITNGVLAASKIRFFPVADVSLEAQVTNVDFNNDTLTIFGTPGIAITIDANTLFDDKSTAALQKFSLNNLSTLSRVSVIGKKTNSNTITGIRLTRIESSSPIVLKGPVSSVTTPALVIMGVRADMDSSTQYQDANGNIISQSQFFNLISTSTIVKVQGAFNGNLITVTTAQIGG